MPVPTVTNRALIKARNTALARRVAARGRRRRGDEPEMLPDEEPVLYFDPRNKRSHGRKGGVPATTSQAPGALIRATSSVATRARSGVTSYFSKERRIGRLAARSRRAATTVVKQSARAAKFTAKAADATRKATKARLKLSRKQLKIDRLRGTVRDYGVVA